MTSLSIPAQAIADAKSASTTLWPVLLAIAGLESGWDPRAEGDFKLELGGPIVKRDTPGAFPTSYGYNQWHIDGGLGTGVPKEILLDGPTNMRLTAEYVQSRLSAGALLYEALRPWSTRDAALELLVLIAAEFARLAESEKDKILGSIDTLWGISQRMDQQADSMREQSQQIRDYVLIIKRAAGLE